MLGYTRNPYVLAVMALVVISACRPTDAPISRAGNDQIPVDLDRARAIALENAVDFAAVEFEPVHASWSTVEHPLFADYHFVYVWGPLGHTQNAGFAVGPRGDLFLLPDEFTGLAEHRGLSLVDEEEALSLLNLYLEFDIVWPGTDRHMILSGIQDIPGWTAGDAPDAFDETQIQPMTISTLDDGWTFDFHTWRSVHGLVLDWTVHITPDGAIHVERRKILLRNAGSYLTPE